VAKPKIKFINSKLFSLIGIFFITLLCVNFNTKITVNYKANNINHKNIANNLYFIFSILGKLKFSQFISYGSGALLIITLLS
jgi:hypothetical protein